MKIIYLVHQFFPEFQSGTEKFVLNIASHSKKYGHDVKVITYYFMDDETFSHDHGEILSKEFIYEGIPVIAYKYKRSEDNILNVLENEKLRSFARKTIELENPDIIHVGHLMRVHEFIWTAIELSIPYIITLTDFFLLCPKVNLIASNQNLCMGPNGGDKCQESCAELNNSYIRYRLDKARIILEKADQLFSPSHFVGKVFKDEYRHLNIKYNPHGILQRDYVKNQRQNNRKDKLVLGYMSSITHMKGIEVLLDAFKGIESQNIGLEIYGHGDEGYVSKLENLVQGNNRIHFHGKYYSEQLEEIYSQFDILIIPSLCYETYSMVLHESLAFNVPVLVSKIGALEEKVKFGKNGLTFFPGNSSDLRKKIEFITANPEFLARMKKYIKNHTKVPTIKQETVNYLKYYIEFISN